MWFREGVESLKPILKQTGLWALAGLMGGVAVGAIAFRSAEPPPSETGAKASSPGRVSKPDAGPTASRRPPATEGPKLARSPADPDPHEEASKRAEAPAPEPEELEPFVEKGMSKALEAAVAGDKWFKRTRLKLHRAIGTGALFSAGVPTAAGKAILARLEALPDHGLDASGYDAGDLKGALASADPATAEAQLGKVLLRLIMEFRFIKRAGPFKLVSEKKLAKDGAAQRRMVKRAIVFVEAALEGSEPFVHLDPPHPSYAALVEAHRRYRGYAQAGGCRPLPTSWKLRPGAKGGPVKQLQTRMACEGYYEGPTDGHYGDTLLAAVSEYQRAHELPDKGLVFTKTIKSMNVPMKRRANQLKLALQRARESRVGELGDYYLYVNVPSFEVRAIDKGQVVRRNRVIVGTNRLDDNKLNLTQGHLNRTKLFKSSLYEVIINPSWILPERVAKGELRGKVAEDPDYLKKMNIHERVLPNGRKVLIQGKGKGNVLGKVKFLLRKSNAIFLHDTDKPWLFREKRRDFSHGCIRVDGAVAFGRWLLERDGYDKQDIERGFKLKTTQRGMKLDHPVPLLTEYMTVDVGEDGKPMFLTDIYGYDKAFAQKQLPPLVKVRWGHIRLRPHWVPRVPAEVVKGWRAAGKPAPRKYDAAKHGGG